MHTTSLNHRLLAALAGATTVLALGFFSGSVRAADFPPLNHPASIESHPGKFVWSELFTADSGSATRFYTGVFGWTSLVMDQHGVIYTVFSDKAGNPIAGLRQRTPGAGNHPSRWIHYIAVTDVAATLANVENAGGEVRAPARNFPNLGLEAIITDNEGSPVGLIQSSSGDPMDVDPAPGAWNWFHLFVKHPQAAADFYHQVFAYDVNPDARMGKKTELLLSNGAFNHAGISALPDREDAKPGWLGTLRVDDMNQTLAQVRALGGEVLVPPREAAYGSVFALISDPTGGTLGLVQYVNNANPVNRP